MPFPLAHPAAVLPLRRYCPKPLNFVALVAGSIAPDLGYLLKGAGLEDVSHSFVPGTVVGMFMGLLLLGGYYCVVKIGNRVLPTRYGDLLHWDFQPGFGGIASIVASLVIGVWSHLLLDSFTHSQGWVVRHVDALQRPLFVFDGRSVRVCHLLWYGGSFVGVALLVMAARRWQDRKMGSAEVRPAKSHVLEAVLVATLVLPIELIHHLVRSGAGLIVVAATTLALTAAVAFRIAAGGSRNESGMRKETGS